MSILQKAYSALELKEQGNILIELLSTHLNNSKHSASQTLNWNTPENQLDFWQNQSEQSNEVKDILQTILKCELPNCAV